MKVAAERPGLDRFTLDDALRSGHKTILRASADPFYRELVNAVPPADTVAALTPMSDQMRQVAMAQIAATSPEELLAGFNFPSTDVLGSNAYGIGRGRFWYRQRRALW